MNALGKFLGTDKDPESVLERLQLTGSDALFRDRYKYKKVLGQGSFGLVLLVTNNENQERALKIISKKMGPNNYELVRQEAKVL